MDKLTKEAQDHEEIYEALTFFRKSLEQLSNEKAPGFVEKMNKFFDEHIDEHFEFEESEIFPSLLDLVTEEEKNFIKELLEDHSRIKGKLLQFKKLSSEYISNVKENTFKELRQLSTEIIEITLDHARKEDMLLFEMMKKYNVKLSD